MTNEIENLTGEEWKQIDEFPNYMVSNKGRVKSLNYKHTGKERILKPGTINKYGHKQVLLCNKGSVMHKYIHRLVAEAFIPCIKKEANFIDHLDTDPTNNCVENLRWVTQQENNQNPLSKLHYRDCKGGKSIYCFETDTIYQSANEASRQLNVNSGNISQCCRGKIYKTGNYHFCYSDNMPDTYELFLH